jgi:L-fucose isomerase-like protein
MKARLVPIYFVKGRDDDFDLQLGHLKDLLADQAEFLDPIPLGDPLPDAEAVIFPQFLGDAYHQVADFKAIRLPILVITSELQVKRKTQGAKFLVFQDNPGEGFQSEIFKRCYWFEDECIQRMQDKFGVQIVKKSFKTLAAQAKAIPDSEAQQVVQEREFAVEGLTSRAVTSAAKMYLVVRRELVETGGVGAVGINCLNESRYSDTTPCLAWNLLYEEQRVIWGCEADIVSMLTKYLLHKILEMPIMMTNLYPFLMGQAALAHERIPHFPEVDEPDNHILAAHCGYLGVVPQSFATQWNLRPKVLAIVDDNASAIDARFPVGDMTLAKFDPSFEKISVTQGSLKNYVQYEDSDCLNGAILKVPDGRRMLDRLTSHHYLLMTGHHQADIDMIGKVFNYQVAEL